MITWNRVNPEIEKAITKVAKLENLAKRASNWAEGSTAKRMANRIREKNGITHYIVTPTPEIEEFLNLILPRLSGVAYEINEYCLAFTAKLSRVVRLLLLTYKRELRKAKRQAPEGLANQYEAWINEGIQNYFSTIREIIETQKIEVVKDYSKYFKNYEVKVAEPQPNFNSYDIDEEWEKEAQEEYEEYMKEHEDNLKDYAEWAEEDRGYWETKEQRKARKEKEKNYNEAVERLMRRASGGETEEEKEERGEKEKLAEAEFDAKETGKEIAKKMVRLARAI